MECSPQCKCMMCKRERNEKVLNSLDKQFSDKKIKAPEFYELTKDYTMRLVPYYASGWWFDRYYLPPHEWDFIKLHGDDFLTIKKGL